MKLIGIILFIIKSSHKWGLRVLIIVMTRQSSTTVTPSPPSCRSPGMMVFADAGGVQRVPHHLFQFAHAVTMNDNHFLQTVDDGSAEKDFHLLSCFVDAFSSKITRCLRGGLGIRLDSYFRFFLGAFWRRRITTSLQCLEVHRRFEIPQLNTHPGFSFRIFQKSAKGVVVLHPYTVPGLELVCGNFPTGFLWRQSADKGTCPI